MITRNREQAAQSQNQVAQYQSRTLAHYATRQKEAQVVYVKSSLSNQFITLANMVPNFMNISDSTGLGASDFYYQVKSFKCSNRFYNIFPNDTIYFRARILWARSDGTGIPTGTTSDDYIPIIYNGSGYQMCNATEIVTLLNTALRRVALDIKYGVDLPGMSTQENNLLNLAQHGYFTCDSDSGKLQFTIQPSMSYLCTETHAVYYAPHNAVMIQCYVDLKIGDTETNYTKLRLGRQFGLLPFLEQDDGMPLVDPNAPLENVVTVGASIYISIPADAPSKAIPNFNTDTYPQIYDAKSTFLSQPLYFSGSCPAPMSIYPYRQIFIRSSLQTNMWMHDGRRSNIIAVVPVNGALSSQAIEYVPVGSDQREYNVKDSLSSLQSFQINLTDEYGQSINFTEDYELQLAIFFSPKDPTIQAF